MERDAKSQPEEEKSSEAHAEELDQAELDQVSGGGVVVHERGGAKDT